MDSFTSGQFERINAYWIAFRESSGCFVNCGGGPVELPMYDVETVEGGVSAVTGPYSDSLTSVFLGDDQVIAIELPFSFDFYGNNFNYAYLSSNGLVSFASMPSTTASHIHHKDPTSKAHKTESAHHAPIDSFTRTTLSSITESDADTVYIIVLHPHVSVSRTHTMASAIRSRHIDEAAVMFEATVLSVQPHLRMLSVQGVSKAALSYLSGHADVNVVQKSVEVKAVGFVEAAYSTDTYSWGLDRIDQVNLPLDNASYLPAGPGVNDGSGVSVYVLDTGIDTTHIAFSGRNVTNIFDAYSNDGSVSDNNDVNG